MSSIYLGAQVFANQNLENSNFSEPPTPDSEQLSSLVFSEPPTPDSEQSRPITTITPVVAIDYSIPALTFDISATNRSFQTNVIITQSPSRSGILFFMQEKIEGSAPPPTRTDATGIRPDYGGQ